MNKKYLPSSGGILCIVLIILASWAMYDVPYPKQYPFSSAVNSHPIGSSIAFVVILILFYLTVAGSLYLIYLFGKYDEWRRKS